MEAISFECLHWGCWGVVIFSADCDVRTPDKSSSAFRILASPPAAGYKLQHSLSRASPPSVPGQPHPGRRPDGVRSSQQVSGRPGSVSFAGPPARACQPSPPPAPQQAASPPDSPPRAVRHAIQHAVGRTASPARLRGSVVPELNHRVGGEHPTATRRHPRGGTFSHSERPMA